MNDQDRDLIISLIEGSLSEQDAAAASARIAADPELATEYENQRTIADALAGSPSVSMTEAERTTLRANLVEQLNLEEAPVTAPATAPRSRESAWWWRPALAFGSVAAVLVIGVAVVPGMFSSSSDSDESIAAFEAVTTVATAEAGDGGADSADDAGGTQSELEVPSLRSTDLDKLLDSVQGESSPEAIEEGAEPYASNLSLEIDLDDVEACREKLGTALPDGDIQVVGAEQGDNGPVVTVVFVDAGGVEGAAQIELSTCILVDLAE